MATRKQIQTGSSAPPVLDLRELVRLQPVITSVGEFQMRLVTALSPLERAEIMEVQERASKLSADDVDTLHQASNLEDRILEAALIGTTRDQRDRIPTPERAFLIASFFGASAKLAREMVEQALTMVTTETEKKPTGGSSRPASRGSTAARRKTS